jgi:hypothetical protein
VGLRLPNREIPAREQRWDKREWRWNRLEYRIDV